MTKKAHSPLIRGVSALALAGGLFAATPALACSGDSPYLGTVCYFAFPYCPEGFLPADGRSLAVTTNQALYALLGNYYGGNQVNFNLPDLRGRSPVGTGQATTPPLSNVGIGQKRGAETVTLTAAQVASHVHPATFTATTGSQSVTIPGQSASGTALTGSGTIDVVPGGATTAGSTSAPAASTTYYLTGTRSEGVDPVVGPYTTTAPGTAKAAAGNVRVNVDASNLKAATSATTVNIPTVTGGTVAVGANIPGAPVPVATLPPQLGLTACITTQGLFPMRP